MHVGVCGYNIAVMECMCLYSVHVYVNVDSLKNIKRREAHAITPYTCIYNVHVKHETVIHVHECRGFESHPRQLIFSRKSDCLGCAVLLYLVCLFVWACLLLSFFLLVSH